MTHHYLRPCKFAMSPCALQRLSGSCVPRFGLKRAIRARGVPLLLKKGIAITILQSPVMFVSMYRQCRSRQTFGPARSWGP